MNQKFFEYLVNNPGLWKGSYEEKESFCHRYQLPEKHSDAYIVNRDDLMENIQNMKINSKIIREAMNNAPYHFITLSREEERAIIGVATGLMEPDSPNFPYPKRMADLKKILVDTEMFYDLGAQIGVPKSSGFSKER